MLKNVWGPALAAIASLSLVATARAVETTTPPATSGVEFFLTPSLDGPWRMQLANNGPAPVRILADARLVWLEVIEAPTPLVPGKKPPRAQAFPRGKIPVCRPPGELRPDGEIEQGAIVLKPGERYEESLDPMLLCGAGKLMAGLKPGAVVYAHYGYPPPAGKPKKDALPPPPYVLDSLSEPRAVLPARTLDATVFVLSSYRPPTSAEATPGEGKQEPPLDTTLVDQRAPRFKLTSTALTDAYQRTDVVLTVTLTNEGQRSALLHIRPDDVSFSVQTPAGKTVVCNPGARQRGAVRDFFETLRAGGKRSLTMHLYEVCPVDTFQQPGIYQATATIDLQENGDTYNLPATVAHVEAALPSKIRVRTGKVPYQKILPTFVRPPSAEPAASSSAAAPPSSSSAPPAPRP